MRTLYVFCNLIESEALILGGYPIIPKLKGGQIQAFPEVLSFFKPLQNQNPFKISLLCFA